MRHFNPGNFRHKIDIMQMSGEKNKYGEQLDTWEVFKAGVSASREPILGKELYAALSAETKIEVKFRSRYVKGVVNNMRIHYKDEVYDIISAVDVDFKESVFYCRLI